MNPVNPEFAFVDELVPGIRWDAKYATWDNFTGKPVDGYLANRIVGTRALCEGLSVAHEEAAARGHGLLVWDGYRPQRAVDRFLRWSREPEDGRTSSATIPASTGPPCSDRGTSPPGPATAGAAPSTSRSTTSRPASWRRWVATTT